MPKQTQTINRESLPLLIRTDTAASLIECSARQVRAMCVKGEVKAVKVGSDWRINTEAFLEQFGI